MDRYGRRQLLQASLVLAGVGSLVACGVTPPWMRPPTRVARIGFLGHPTIPDGWINQFREELGARHHIESETYIIERRFTEGKLELLPQLAAELIAIPVDVIVTRGAPPALAARELTRTIPIVFIGAADPLDSGLVVSLSQPGGNVTGLSALPSELGSKCLELLKESFPSILRVAVVLNPTAASVRQWQIVREVAAPRLGLQVYAVELPGKEDIETALAASGTDADALLVIHDSVLLQHAARITAIAARTRLPAMYQFRPYVADAGGLMSYETDPSNVYQRAAVYVDKILNGARPADLPVEAPTRFRFTLNVKTAAALGLAFPQAMLQQATEIIQ